MIIEIHKQHSRNRWSVHMDAWEAGFNSLGEAESFVRLLKARIDAPHDLPAIRETALSGHLPVGISPRPPVSRGLHADGA